MKNNQIAVAWLGLFSVLASFLPTAQAQGTAFTYQGRLSADGAAANGSYHLASTLYTDSTGGSVLAGAVSTAARRHGALIAPTWDGSTQRETDSDAALRWASDGGSYSVLPCVPPAGGSDGGRARKGLTERDSTSLCRQDADSTLRRFIRR